MERQERAREALEAIGAELKKLFEQWLPVLEGNGFLSELGESHIRNLTQVELSHGYVGLLSICSRESLDVLSPREKQIARLVRAGRSNKEIAQELKMSVQTVGSYLKKIYAKLGIHSRVLLSQYARLIS